MKADAIYNRILEDARLDAARMIEDARARAEMLREKNEDLIEEKRSQAVAAARLECDEMRDRMLRMAELERRKSALRMKREVIDLAFRDALGRLRAMPDEDARAFMEKRIARASEDGEELVVDQADKGVFDQSFVDRVNKRLKSPISLSSDTCDLGGGALLRRPGMEVNLSYAAALNEVRPALEAEVAQALFG
ncbi:MAG: hypothetical protein GX592_05140 [Clostridiales bacterium]|nr:hypothetical protein [Clostridiales bacterium]